MEKLEVVLEKTMQGYAGEGFNGYSYFMKNEAEQVMSVVAKFIFEGEKYVEASLLAMVVDNRIIIEDDKTIKPLVDALMQAGIPRDQVVLAYAGEIVKETP